MFHTDFVKKIKTGNLLSIHFSKSRAVSEIREKIYRPGIDHK